MENETRVRPGENSPGSTVQVCLQMQQTLASFRCISCASPSLSLCSKLNSNSAYEHSLVCKECEKVYEVREGVPRFVDDQNYSRSFGFQWNKHDKTQLDSHTGLAVSRQRLFDVTGWPTDMSGQLILEAGSGAGRFTECLLDTGARVFSFDSSSAVESNWSNNGDSERLQLFQADICNIPLRSESFDKVLCLGVLQHTPDPERSFKSLAQMARVGGEVVVDVYRKDLVALLQWKYVLRPVTRRMNPRTLYTIVSNAAPRLVPLARTLRRLAGRVGARLVPIVEYSHLGFSAEVNRDWAILDTFDMYSPEYDYPQTRRTLLRWYTEAGFESVIVRRGPNGLVGKGRRTR
jgi:SAM-dependent methyltransferase